MVSSNVPPSNNSCEESIHSFIPCQAAIGPANEQAADVHNDDMRRAIEASLSMTNEMTIDTYDELPLEQRVRQGDWFVALFRGSLRCCPHERTVQ